jgi:uncharacterized membrane protein YvbJ
MVQGQKWYQWKYGKVKKGGKPFSPHQNNLVQDPEGNEENEYLHSDSKKTKINYAKEPKEAHTERRNPASNH